jgi:hypothetical protein
MRFRSRFGTYATYPAWIDALDTSQVTPENWRAWIAGVVAEHGPTVTLTPMAWSALAEKSPIETAAEMFGEDRLIVAPAPPSPSRAETSDG